MQLHRISKSLSDAHWLDHSKPKLFPISIKGFTENNKSKKVTVKQKKNPLGEFQ